MKIILLTGFEPFGGEVINASAEIARRLDGERIAGRRVAGRVLPCVFRTSLPALRRHLRELAPDAVVCLGQAGGRAAITPERVAVNVDDARLPDNAGACPADQPVVRGGPAAYWSRLPVKAMAAAMSGAGIPAEVSNTAGTFVCNHVFYGLMHTLRQRRGVTAGFIHVPWLPGQGEPSLTLEQMCAGIRLALAAAGSKHRQ